MESTIDFTAPLDYIEFQIVPTQNRYEAWACIEDGKEKASSGLLDHLLLHSAEIKALHSKGSSAKYKLLKLENSLDIEWFNKSTLIRFLHIIDSVEIMDVTSSLKNEILQLEEARGFHLSLYAKDSKYPIQSDQSDDRCSEGTGLTTKAEGSDASKNELLRAIDVRLTSLRGELATAFDQATGSGYSLEEMIDIYKFSQHFGSTDLSDSLRKYIEMRQGDQAAENKSISKQFSESDRVGSKERNNRTDKSKSSEMIVKYGVSPAKAEQVERQSSTETDESSFSSDGERISVERSRTFVRTASPRRSASPMRRVQIGRSGSRRSTAITIKSLNYYPARKKDEDDSGEEGPEQAHTRKSENSNAKRMSVQDAINLFESKQKEQKGEDTRKAKSLLNANKSVLRRWSSGMGEEPPQFPQDTSVEGATEIQNNVENTMEDYPNETCEKDVNLESLEDGTCSPVVTQEEPHLDDVNEKSNASAEWGRQKEAELNELFMKMMETNKPVKIPTVEPASSKRQSLPTEQRGGFYNHYKEKRDEKLRVEAAKKKTEKEKQFRSTPQVHVKKSKLMTPANTSDDSKKLNVKKIQKPQKSNSVSQPENPKTERIPRLGNVKKDSPKSSSSLPATRKSWPSVPSARSTGLSPAKTPPSTSSNVTTPTGRRSQPTPSLSLSSSKVATSQTRPKPIKSIPSDTRKSPITDPGKKQQSLTKPNKTAKNKVVQTAPNKDLTSSKKPTVYSKATKKSSVVPLESKPLIRKGSKTTSGTKKASNPKEPVRKYEDRAPAEENVALSNTSDTVNLQEKNEIEELKIDMGMELGPTTPRSPQKCGDEGFNQISPTDDAIDLMIEPELKSEAEDELTISPRAWVEIEENEDHSITSVDHTVGLPADIAPVEVSSPRVRHSLSQMLLKESSEPDFIDWGNAENPPPIVFQKDAPKGLKRLLKFARKSKNEGITTDWLNPSAFSEGEDDATDDSKLMSKRSAENLPRKSTLHSMNNGHQKSSTDFEHTAQANISNLNAQSLPQQFQQGYVSSSVTTTKATRSFFSLSAFKGNK